MAVKPIPDRFNTISAYATVKDAAAAIEFYKKAFGAEEFCRMPGPDGKGVMHAELAIGDSVLMIGEEFPGMAESPATLGGSPVTLHIYCEDADQLFQRAIDAGAKILMPLADQFWGDRMGKLTDPFGHHWSIATHKEDLTDEQVAERAAAAFGKECAS